MEISFAVSDQFYIAIFRINTSRDLVGIILGWEVVLFTVSKYQDLLKLVLHKEYNSFDG